MKITEIKQRLIEGNNRFVSDMSKKEWQDTVRRNALVEGQAPYAIVLSCADSRVVPELAFDTGLGELFVVRVAGNIANSSSIASIEYAVAHCGAQVIIVLGHQSCGAVTAAVHGGDNGYNLNHLLSHITPALAVSEDRSDIASIIKKNAQLNAKELANRSEIIGKAVLDKKVEIIPAYYHLDTGKVDFL